MDSKWLRPCFIFVSIILFGNDPAWAEKAPKQRVKLKPELIYRNAQIEHRSSSAFYREEEDVNFIDQFFLGINMDLGQKLSEQIILYPAFRNRTKAPNSLDIFIAEAYFRKSVANSVQFIAGRKVEFSGVSYLFRPSDLLNEDINIFDPLTQKEGKVFTRVSWLPGDFHLDLGFIPNRANDAEEGLLWLQSGLVWGDSEFEVQATYNKLQRTSLGMSALYFWNEHFEVHWDARMQTKQRSTSQEATRPFSGLEAEESSFFHVLGTRLILTAKRSFIFEAVQNTAGLLPDEMKKYHEDVKAQPISPEWQQRLQGRKYAFLAYRDDSFSRKLNVSLHGAVNIDDSSLFGAFFLSYQWSSLIKVELSPTFFTGSKDSEFGQVPYKSILYASLNSTL